MEDKIKKIKDEFNRFETKKLKDEINELKFAKKKVERILQVKKFVDGYKK